MDDCSLLPHLLVIDDDERLRRLLQKFLRGQGFLVATADTAQTARRKLRSLSFDLLIVDVMMPGESGLSLTEGLREQNDIPIILLTAMGEAQDRLSGLRSGADDYLTKPFEPMELVLRVRAILRRATQKGDGSPPLVLESDSYQEIHSRVSFGPFRFDREKHQLWKKRDDGGEHFIRLTDNEAVLLSTLAICPNETVGREEIVQKLSNTRDITTRKVDVQVTRLRRKIERNPKYPEYLQTVRGVGYRLLAANKESPWPERGLAKEP